MYSNRTNGKSIAALILLVAVIGCLVEWVFYNYPVVNWFGLQNQLPLLSRLYDHSQYWLTMGIFWRIGLLLSFALVIFLSRTVPGNDMRLAPYLILTILGVVGVLSCHLLLRHNKYTTQYALGNAAEILGVIAYLSGTTNLHRILVTNRN